MQCFNGWNRASHYISSFKGLSYVCSESGQYSVPTLNKCLKSFQFFLLLKRTKLQFWAEFTCQNYTHFCFWQFQVVAVFDRPTFLLYFWTLKIVTILIFVFLSESQRTSNDLKKSWKVQYQLHCLSDFPSSSVKRAL